jgi:membrane protein DedA with SNARE-associated domain
MTEIMEQVRVWVEQIILALGYPGITLVMLVENLFPPIPSEVVMPFAGFLAAQGKLNLFAAIAAGTVGSVAGAAVLYYIGRWADEPVVRAFLRRWGRFITVTEEDLDRVMLVFKKYGPPIVFFGRLIPIIRSLISVPAGMNRMPFGRFLLFTTLGSTIWTAVLAYAGVLLAEHWEQILVYSKQYERVTLFIIGLAVIAYFAWRFMLARRQAQSKRAENQP